MEIKDMGISTQTISTCGFTVSGQVYILAKDRGSLPESSQERLAKEQSFHQGVLFILNPVLGIFQTRYLSIQTPQPQKEIHLSCGQLLVFVSGDPGDGTGTGPVLRAWGSKSQKKCLLN